MEEKVLLEKVDPCVAGASKRWDGFLEAQTGNLATDSQKRKPHVNSLLTVYRKFPLYYLIASQYCFFFFNEICWDARI